MAGIQIEIREDIPDYIGYVHALVKGGSALCDFSGLEGGSFTFNVIPADSSRMPGLKGVQSVVMVYAKPASQVTSMVVNKGDK